MMKPGLLKAETIALLQTPLRLTPGVSTDFALGWKVEHVQFADASTPMVAHRATPTLRILAVMNLKRRPGYWVGRT